VKFVFHNFIVFAHKYLKQIWSMFKDFHPCSVMKNEFHTIFITKLSDVKFMIWFIVEAWIRTKCWKASYNTLKNLMHMVLCCHQSWEPSRAIDLNRFTSILNCHFKTSNLTYSNHYYTLICNINKLWQRHKIQTKLVPYLFL
jgi:hypothetical protein